MLEASRFVRSYVFGLRFRVEGLGFRVIDLRAISGSCAMEAQHSLLELFSWPVFDQL